MRRILGVGATVIVLGFIAIQLVPYGREHANPPVTGEPPWDSAATQAVFMEACSDCHSNETRWPWYTNIAPLSWRIQQHVDEGREALNVSEWGSGEQEADEAAEVVREGEMPPGDYLILHPEARLAGEEKDAFIAGLEATFGGEGAEGAEGGDEAEGGEDED